MALASDMVVSKTTDLGLLEGKKKLVLEMMMALLTIERSIFMNVNIIGTAIVGTEKGKFHPTVVSGKQTASANARKTVSEIRLLVMVPNGLVPIDTATSLIF